MNISDTTRQILAPLSLHKSQLLGADPSRLVIGTGSSSNPNTPTITHDEFVMRATLPSLAGACAKYGQESVARDIVDLVLPLYKIDTGKYENIVAAFLNVTLRESVKKEDATVSNPTLAKKYGMRYVFDPIARLIAAHERYRVFSSVNKFLYHHACRMGEVIDGFSQTDYLAYVELCEKLLKNGVYDWSLENSPEQWGMLRPCIRQFGLKAVMEPMVDAMIAVGRIRGTKDGKYKYSFMASTIQDLYPLMLPRIRKDGVRHIDILTGPLVKYVLRLHKKGAFHEKAYSDSVEGKFFRSIAKDNLPQIKTFGMQWVLENSASWELKLLEDAA